MEGKNYDISARLGRELLTELKFLRNKSNLLKEPVCHKSHTIVWESSPEESKWEKQYQLGIDAGQHLFIG